MSGTSLFTLAWKIQKSPPKDQFLLEKPMLLIADDNSDVRRMLRDLIEDIDPEIIECSDGGEAVKAYERHRPHWVLVDIEMAPMDGLTATREILRRHPQAKVIVVTQHDDVRTRETAMRIGAYAFVGKGNLTSLREILRAQKVVVRKEST